MSGGDDNNVLLWSLNDINNLNEEIQPIKLGNHRGKIADLEFSNNGRYLISASWDGTVGVWDLKKRKKLTHLLGIKGLFTQFNTQKIISIYIVQGMMVK